jgi:hypothetical protein
VVHPLAEITRVTEQVAEGNAVAIPYGPRRDEIGALSRSISVFQHAMMHGDWPKVSIAEAFESMCADFLAGPHRQRIGKTFQDYADEVKRIVQPAADRQENIYGGCHSCGGWVYHSCPKPEATEPETCGGCGVRIDEGDHKECARRAC